MTAFPARLAPLLLGSTALISLLSLPVLAEPLINIGRLVYDSDSVLTQDLVNERPGRVTVRADLDAAGYDITNRGNFLIENGEDSQANLRNVNQLTSDGRFTIEPGARVSAAAVRVTGGQFVINGELAAPVQNEAAGRMVLTDGLIRGSVENLGAVEGTGRITGTLNNVGRATIGGRTGAVTNSGVLTTNSDLVADGLTNIGGTVIVRDGDRLTSAEVANDRELRLSGTLTGTVRNAQMGLVMLDGGLIEGGLSNGGRVEGQGSITGRLGNRGLALIGGSVGTLINSGSLEVDGALAAGVLENQQGGILRVGAGQRLSSEAAIDNAGDLALAGRLDAALTNTGRVGLQNGQIAGRVVNGGQLDGTGTITGDVITRQSGVTALGGRIDGNVTNYGGRLSFGQDLLVTGQIRNTAGSGTGGFEVGREARVTAQGGTINQQSASMTLAGRLESDVITSGSYGQTGTLDGRLTIRGGVAEVAGRVSGDLRFDSGRLTLGDGLRIGGTLAANADLALAAGNSVTAGAASIGRDATLSLAGTLQAPLQNAGTLRASGAGAKVAGSLQGAQGGLVDLSDASTETVLTVAGLSGENDIRMDIDTGNRRADRIAVSGGPVTGRLHFGFQNLSDQVAATTGERITLLTLDRRFGTGNDFAYSFDPISTASERIVYSVDRDRQSGNLTLVSQLNPAIGAMFANITLVQSLIGSVVNRPTSPYVSGLVTDSADKPCGTGGWGRATGGRATLTGLTDNRVSVLENEVTANYYGMQGGIDLSCFDARFGGWDTSFGVLMGVNKGESDQPIRAINGTDSQATTGAIASVTTTDFTQSYGGLYATASKDRWVADLQLRKERTTFQIENRAITGSGLGIADPDFSSDGFTLSGSVSYTMPMGESGWSIAPTAGFAWSRYSTDNISFEDGFLMSFDDSERKVGFFGASISKPFLFMEQNAALQAFATATYYRDFADDAVSRLYNDELAGFDTQIMRSEILKEFGEVSLGANYVKVLAPGRWGKARQLSTSARVDGRFGDAIDSVGVTAQFRFQF
ncbi:autotransporter outer membrane beta-barrel domain-containing protein [Paracoccus jeotgali]|uniref:Autotransporter domain-containing protein n=1 Tax=Paracoccus jeotgali TaxID=2065379 RepID=A0A2K9MDM8_9RHOB|nr:autotransporter outer membrane beta-barrel domain-containing protein [Paracoccus jeotgali]AUM73738.1 hypothetical protein CYR75_05080 [Paracoccus jeotgali]